MGYLEDWLDELDAQEQRHLRHFMREAGMAERTEDGSTNPKKAYGDRKPKLHLVPPALAIGAAKALAEGAVKYGPYNWRQKRVDALTYIGAIMRHMEQYRDGEDVDPESATGKTHLEGAAACLAILLDTTAMGTLVDNRPPRGPAPEMLRDPSAALQEPVRETAPGLAVNP